MEPFFTVAKQAGNATISSNLAVDRARPDDRHVLHQPAGDRKDKGLVDDFTAAIQESLKYAQDNPDEVRRILLTYTKIEPEVADAITLPAFPSEINRDSVETLADLMVKYGMAEKKPDVDASCPDRVSDEGHLRDTDGP